MNNTGTGNSMLSEKGWRNYGKLRNSITIELNKELGNWEKKLNFYLERELQYTEKADVAIRLCKKIINLIEQFHKNSDA